MPSVTTWGVFERERKFLKNELLKAFPKINEHALDNVLFNFVLKGMLIAANRYYEYNQDKTSFRSRLSGSQNTALNTIKHSLIDHLNIGIPWQKEQLDKFDNILYVFRRKIDYKMLLLEDVLFEASRDTEISCQILELYLNKNIKRISELIEKRVKIIELRLSTINDQPNPENEFKKLSQKLSKWDNGAQKEYQNYDLEALARNRGKYIARGWRIETLSFVEVEEYVRSIFEHIKFCSEFAEKAYENFERISKLMDGISISNDKYQAVVSSLSEVAVFKEAESVAVEQQLSEISANCKALSVKAEENIISLKAQLNPQNATKTNVDKLEESRFIVTYSNFVSL